MTDVTVYYFFLSVLIVLSNCYDRKLETKYNPGCPDSICGSEAKGNYGPVNLVYTKAVGAESTLHWVLAGGGRLGQLSALLLHSSELKSSLTFNWTMLMASSPEERVGAITMVNGGSVMAYSIVFTRLFEYNDVADSANISLVNQTSKTIQQHPTSDLNWNNVDKETGPGGVARQNAAVFNATSFVNGSSGGIFNSVMHPSLIFKFTHMGDDVRAPILPRLLFTGNNTQLELTLDHLLTAWSNSRFSIEVALATSRTLGKGENMLVHDLFSVDDEFTPGIFQINSFLGQPDSAPEEKSCYLQWKPVCYTTSDRHLKSTTEVKNSDPPVPLPPSADQLDVEEEEEETKNGTVGPAALLRSSLAYVWFGEGLIEGKASSMRLMNVSFGVKGDKFYRNTNYTVWTASFGTGRPPVDEVSIIVILIIACGLGLPVVLIIVGSLFVFIRKRRIAARETPYQPINT